jgi:hypothetical protein
MYVEDQRDAVLSSLCLFYCQATLHVSGVSRTHHQEYTNCSYNHWYRSCIWKCSDKIRLKRVHGRAAVAACISLLSHTCHMTHSSHPPCFGHPIIFSKEYWSYIRLIIKYSRSWNSSPYWFILVKYGTCDSLLEFALSCSFLCVICPLCLPNLVWALWFFHPHILWPYILGGFWNPLKTEI